METIISNAERIVFRIEDEFYMVTQAGGKYLANNFVYRDGNIHVKKLTYLVKAKNKNEVRQSIKNGTIEWFQT